MGDTVDDQGDFRPILPTFGPDEPGGADCSELESCRMTINLDRWPDLPEGYRLGEPEIVRGDDGLWYVAVPLVPTATEGTGDLTEDRGEP